jgi:hypothetical protein
MKIINNGLNLYPIRHQNEKRVNGDRFILPPIYSAFLDVYHVGRKQLMNSELYLDDRYNEKLGLTYCVYEPDPENISLGSLFLPEESEEIMHIVFSSDDPIHTMDLFLIGEDGMGHNFFMVGTGSDNLDQIYIESSDYSYKGGERITKLSDNIFQFLKSFLIVEIEGGIGYGVGYDKLYKNWGDDFWRVKAGTDEG